MKHWIKSRLSKRQYELLRMLSYEWKRLRCRLAAPKSYSTDLSLLQVGSGDRQLDGWFNIDLWQSDLNLDIAAGALPFKSDHFEAIVSQHVIEHLTLEDELLPLLKECRRVLSDGGELWLSTPDMEKVAKSYLEHKNQDMIKDRQERLPHWNLGDLPSQHFMNDMFHQQLEHRNLFDFELLKWTLEQAGFQVVNRVEEADLLNRFEGFPQRKDDYQSLYVVAKK